VRLLALPSYDYAFLEFNLRSPGAPGRPHAVFGERAVRRAFAMAVDRQALVTNVLGAYGRTALGPVTRAQATADTSPGAAALPPYDAAGARTLLDALGWHIGPNGIRQRAGANLAFDVLVPTSSANRRHAAVVLQAMFRAVGADMRIHSVDAAAMGAALEAGTFDAALQALRVDPSPSQIRDVWTTSAGRRTRGSPAGFNYGGYSNARVDAWIDSASVVTAPGEALRLYRQSYAAITADAPAIFLYEPVGLVAYDSRWRPVGVRPDAWWAGLERWSRRDVPEPRTR
jgi:peptide/nickel transport system substrate-binding protein